METPLKGQAAPEQVAAWKAEHPIGIYSIEIDGHVAYFKKPNRKEMNCAMSKASKESALDLFEELANLTWIGGSNDVLAVDELFYGLVDQLKLVIEGKKARLVNL
ncbi:hypothetical protein GCM10023093_17010 [Nemorincola caseinilytica]|uniref:Uncharacterized protein n=1 Tax=Nemorincola caseinilytica TaxID=2054315 RepID=A0ABP8NCW4_9BACT